ncbi:MAG TPA: biotin--[acetyl-CoA-carboxylase] ligase, partial [Bacillota bacterium]|nr:biotin--[acetyl-CoA-carboxylase] ligase [Bacillota bacterium]
MKERILMELNQNKQDFISGQYLSDRLGISRTAVWKYINSLKKQGYEIEAVPNKGYRLVTSPDVLIPEEVYPLLKTSVLGRKIIHSEKLASTSTLAKEIAPQQQEGTLVIAEEQTGGRGRLGRKWYSPRGGGIWASLILKPRIRPEKAYQLTQVAAVAVVKAIKETTGILAGIKWPNDIIINGKKVCGILTEMNAEADAVNHIILSIGLNVKPGEGDMPLDLKDKMTFLDVERGFGVSRKGLLAVLLGELEKAYHAFLDKGFETVAADCRRFSVLLGREVRVEQMDRIFQ